MKIELKIFLILMLLCISKFTNGQDNMNLMFADLNTKQPIDLVVIAAEKSSRNYLTNQLGQASIDSRDSLLSVFHLKYLDISIRLYDFQNGDTVFLTEKINQLKTFEVTAKRENTYKILTEAFRKSRKRFNQSEELYSFYLESYSEGVLKEQIKALLNISSSKKYTLFKYDNQIETGDFVLNPANAFLNYQTDELILSFSPLKTSGNDFHLITNHNRFGKRKFEIHELDCQECNANEVLYSLTERASQDYALIKFNKAGMQIIDISYFFNASSDIEVFDLENAKTALRELKLGYSFSQDGSVIDNIFYSFKVSDKNDTTRVGGFFKRSTKTLNTYNFSTNKFDYESIYHNIILNVSPSKALLSQYFDHTSFHKDSMISNGISSRDESMNRTILSIFDSNEKIREWSQKRMTPDFFNFNQSTNPYNIDFHGRVHYNEDVFYMNWIFNITESSNGDLRIQNLPSLWVGSKTEIYGKENNISFNNFRSNLFFDLSQLWLNDLHEKIIRQNYKWDDRFIIKTEVKKAFSKAKSDIIQINQRLLNNSLPFSALDSLNGLILSRLGVDNLKNLFIQELPTMTNDMEANSVLEQYNLLTYRRFDKNDSTYLASNERAIEFYHILIDYYKSQKDNDNYNQKVLASYYRGLAQSYRRQNDLVNHCKYINKFKENWEEGYQELLRRDMIKPCRIEP